MRALLLLSALVALATSAFIQQRDRRHTESHLWGGPYEVIDSMEDARPEATEHHDEAAATTAPEAVSSTETPTGVTPDITVDDDFFESSGEEAKSVVETTTKAQVIRDGETTTIRTKGRHDPCILPRIIPVAEAMLALVLADAWLEQKKFS